MQTIRRDGIEAYLDSPAMFQDPYALYEVLREDHPVYRSPTLDAWMVSRHDDVAALLRDTDRLSSFGWEQRQLRRLPAEALDMVPELVRHHATPSIVTSDPPFHTRVRRSVIRGFTPTSIERLRPRVETLVSELLQSEGEPAFDVIARLAYPLPAAVIAELIGIPGGDRDRFRSWTMSQTAFFGAPRPDPALAVKADRDLRAFRRYLGRLIDDRRRIPRDDIASVFADGSDDGLHLSEDEILATMVIFLVAGHETTTNLIGNAVLGLLRDPGGLDAVRGGARRWADVVEEALRHESPVQRVRRTAIVDLDLHGQTITAGSTVMLLIGSANRDPEVHADAARFDPARPPTPHLAFGHGPHFCLGASLARMEAGVALPALFGRRDGPALSEGWTARWAHSMTLRGLRSLEVASSD